MTDYIKRADAIGIIEDYIGKDYMTPMSRLYSVRSEVSALPSAETHDKRTETHGVCSDLISRADAIEAVKHSTAYMHDDLYEAISIRIPSAETTGALDDAIAKYVADGLMELPSADAVTIHEDGTLEVKVPNAHKVGRVLVMDTDSHIGGGLFYPDDAVQGEWLEIEDYNGDYHYQCSVCKDEFYLEYGTPKENGYAYCPSCGAIMYREDGE